MRVKKVLTKNIAINYTIFLFDQSEYDMKAKIIVDRQELLSKLTLAKRFLGKKDFRDYLNYVKIEVNDNLLTIIASDGFSLFKAELKVGCEHKCSEEVVVDHNAVANELKKSTEEFVDLEMYSSLHATRYEEFLSIDGVSIKVTGMKYPDFDRILDVEVSDIMLVGAKELKKSVKNVEKEREVFLDTVDGATIKFNDLVTPINCRVMLSFCENVNPAMLKRIAMTFTGDICVKANVDKRMLRVDKDGVTVIVMLNR